MAFERLQALGDEQFGKILNLLMRGEPAMALARIIQAQPPKGWGLFQDIAEKTLTQQLNRLRHSAAEGAFGKKAAQRIIEGATPQIKLLEHVNIRVIERMEELASIQRDRVLMLIEKEKALKYIHLSTDDVIEGYRKILLDLQKIRFDLGLDEFKGPVPHTTFKGASQTTNLPDGTNIQRQVFEAVSTIEQIFDARKIPQLIAREP